jgi:hypothetical protein
MTKHHITPLLSLLLLLGSSVAAQTADSSHASKAEKPGVVQRMQRAVVRGSEGATGLLHRATKPGKPEAKQAAGSAEKPAATKKKAASRPASKTKK